jgi:hypothetical protein
MAGLSSGLALPDMKSRSLNGILFSNRPAGKPRRKAAAKGLPISFSHTSSGLVAFCF